MSVVLVGLLGLSGFTRLYQSIYTGAEEIDMVKVHRVATEPFATATMKDVDATLSTGYVQMGPEMTAPVVVVEAQTIVTGTG